MAALYARVSSARQAADRTIESQIEALKTYAASNDLEVPPEWVFVDDGYSGAKLERPALEGLRDLVCEVPVDVVVAYAPDRLARKYSYQALLVEELARGGTEVRFVKAPRAETAEDELLIQFQGMIAEYERAQIIERTRRGKLHKARTGTVNVLGGAPYGYRYVTRGDDTEARYEIVDTEADIVRELFRRYSQDAVSIADLARWLIDEGITTRKGKNTWDRSTIWGMLRNPAYAGRAAFGKTRRSDEAPMRTRPIRLAGKTTAGRTKAVDRPPEEWITIPVPPIVTDTTFDLAQRRLEENRRFARRRTKEATLLQGLCVCGVCGYAYYRTSTRTSARKIYYYRCLGSDNYRYPDGARCTSKPLRQDDLDRRVWDHICALLTNPALVRDEIDRRLQTLRTQNPATTQRGRLDRELAKTNTAIGRLTDAYQEQLITLDEFRSRMPPLRQRAAKVTTELDRIDAELVDTETYLALTHHLEAFLERLETRAGSASIEDRQQVVRALVKEVQIHPDHILVRHSIPTPKTDQSRGCLLRVRSRIAAVGEHLPHRLRSQDGNARSSGRAGPLLRRLGVVLPDRGRSHRSVGSCSGRAR